MKSMVCVGVADTDCISGFLTTCFQGSQGFIEIRCTGIPGILERCIGILVRDSRDPKRCTGILEVLKRSTGILILQRVCIGIDRPELEILLIDFVRL